MSFYSSKANRGFYSDEIHGARLMSVLDPSWVRPTVIVTLQPGEALGAVLNDGNEPIDIEAPDFSVDHPTILVENPDCRLPEDAVEISAERRAACLAATTVDWTGDLPAPGPEPITDPSLPLRKEAQLELTASDRVAIRCTKAGKPYPADWAARDEALRVIVRTGRGAIPQRPDYPVDT